MRVRAAKPLRHMTGGEASVEVSAATVREAMEAAGLSEVLRGDGGTWGHVQVFLNDEDCRYLEGGLDAPCEPSDEVSVLVAVAGG